MSSGRCEDHVDAKTASLTIEGNKQEVDIYGVKLDWLADASNEGDSGRGSHSKGRYLKCHVTMPADTGGAPASAKQGPKTIILEIPGRQPFVGKFTRTNYFEGTNSPRQSGAKSNPISEAPSHNE